MSFQYGGIINTSFSFISSFIYNNIVIFIKILFSMLLSRKLNEKKKKLVNNTKYKLIYFKQHYNSVGQTNNFNNLNL